MRRTEKAVYAVSAVLFTGVFGYFITAGFLRRRRKMQAYCCMPRLFVKHRGAFKTAFFLLKGQPSLRSLFNFSVCVIFLQIETLFVMHSKVLKGV